MALNASPEQKAYMLLKAKTGAVGQLVAREKAKHARPDLGELLQSDAGRAQLSVLMFGVGDNGNYNPALQHPYYRAMDEIEDRHKWLELARDLTEAENALVAWAKGNCERATKAHSHLDWAKVMPLFDAWPLHGDLRESFLDICMVMAVER